MDAKFIFIADYDYLGKNNNELSIQVGDTVKVSDTNDQLYYGINLRTEEYGWVLSSYGHVRKKSPYESLPDEDKLAKRKVVLHNIIKNESDFISKIHEFIYYVINPLNMKDTAFKKTFLADPAVAVSFHILEELFKVTTNFINVLKKSYEDNDISQAFQQFAPSLQLFAQYASENAKLLNAVKSNFRQLLQIIPDNYSIENVLIQPIEHYNSYGSQYQEFVWLNPSNTIDVNALDASLGLIISYTRIVDEKIREEERNWLLLNLQSQFAGDPVIFTPNRILLKEGEILRIKFSSDHTVDVKSYYAHLFNDAFIYSARNRMTGAFKLNKAIDLKTATLHLGIAPQDKEPIFYFEMKDNQQSEPIHLRFAKSEDASQWISLIQEQIESLKIKKKPIRRASALTKMATQKSFTFDTKSVGTRAQLTHKFLMDEIQFADLMYALNITVIQPLIAASKGVALNAVQLMTDEDLPDKHSEALFDTQSNGSNSNINASQQSAIKDALQDPDVKIFLRAAESISSISREFCNGLESLCKSTGWSENTDLGSYFNSISVLSLYNQFKSYTDGQQAMYRILCTSPFSNFYRDAESYLSNFPGSLRNKLELPTNHVKDIGKYLLELKSFTPDSVEDKVLVISAIEAISFITTEIDELIRIKTNFEILLKIQSSFVLTQSSIIQNLAIMTRSFLKVGDFKKVCRKKNKLFRFWLFNDYLIYGNSLGGDSYSFNRALDLHTTSVKAHESREFMNAIEVLGAEKSFIILASSEIVQKEWVDSIQSAKANLIGTSESNTFIQNEDIAPLWVPDNNSDVCTACQKEFTFWNRRHHCRKCGSLVCSEHLKNKMLIPHIHKTQLQKVCDNCFYYKPSLKSISTTSSILSSFKDQDKKIVSTVPSFKIPETNIKDENIKIIDASNSTVKVLDHSKKDDGDTLKIESTVDSRDIIPSVKLITANNTKMLMQNFNKAKNVDSKSNNEVPKRYNVRAPPPPPSSAPPQESILIASITRGPSTSIEPSQESFTRENSDVSSKFSDGSLEKQNSKSNFLSTLSKFQKQQESNVYTDQNIKKLIVTDLSPSKVHNVCDVEPKMDVDINPDEPPPKPSKPVDLKRSVTAPPSLITDFSINHIPVEVVKEHNAIVEDTTPRSLDRRPPLSQSFETSLSFIESEPFRSVGYKTISELSIESTIQPSSPKALSPQSSLDSTISKPKELRRRAPAPPPLTTNSPINRISAELVKKRNSIAELALQSSDGRPTLSKTLETSLSFSESESLTVPEKQIDFTTPQQTSQSLTEEFDLHKIINLSSQNPTQPLSSVVESPHTSMVFLPPSSQVESEQPILLSRTPTILPPPFIPPPPPFIPPPPQAREVIIEIDEFTRKYMKMKELLPEGAVRQKMKSDGFSTVDIEDFINGKILKLNPPDMYSVTEKDTGNFTERRKALTSTRNTANDIIISNNGIHEKRNGSMLDAICRRRNSLKKLTEEDKRMNKPADISSGGLLGTLALAMTKRRFNMKVNENSDSDSSGWDTDSDGE